MEHSSYSSISAVASISAAAYYGLLFLAGFLFFHTDLRCYNDPVSAINLFVWFQACTVLECVLYLFLSIALVIERQRQHESNTCLCSDLLKTLICFGTFVFIGVQSVLLGLQAHCLVNGRVILILLFTLSYIPLFVHVIAWVVMRVRAKNQRPQYTYLSL